MRVDGGSVVPPAKPDLETSPIRVRQAERKSTQPPRPMLLAAALAALLWGVGCASHVRTPHPSNEVAGAAFGRPTFVEVAASAFDYPDQQPYATAPIVGEERDYWIRSLAFASVGENGQDRNLVTGRYYQGKGAGARPLVIVLPIWGVHNYPSDTIAADLRARSAGAVNVLRILGEERLFDWDAAGDVASEAEFFAEVDQMVDRFVTTVIDIRRVIDWAAARPEIDPRRIALVGFSMGAVLASVVIAHEPRLAAGVLVMGGADLHEILTSCGSEFGTVRERVLEQLDWSVERFRAELEWALAEINPARFAGMADPRRVLIIEAGEDTCVPQSARDRLWHALGRPERIAYRYDHRMAFLAMTFLGGYDLQRHVYRFLDRALAERPGHQLTEDEGAPRGGDRVAPG